MLTISCHVRAISVREKKRQKKELSGNVIYRAIIGFANVKSQCFMLPSTLVVFAYFGPYIDHEVFFFFLNARIVVYIIYKITLYKEKRIKNKSAHKVAALTKSKSAHNGSINKNQTIQLRDSCVNIQKMSLV